MRPRTARRRLGLGLMATALIGALAAAGPAAAQDDEQVDTPITIKAQIAYPLNDAIPDTLLNSFPPQVVCVVFPEACPEQAEPIRDPITGALGEVNTNQETSPLQPVNPNGLTLSFTGGAPRYAAALQVELPTIPEGEEIDSFVLTMPQTDPSFSYDSPAFRRAVLAAVATAGSQDPQVFQDQLTKALTEEEPFSEPLIGIEACPLLVPVPEDAEPPQSKPVEEVSTTNADDDLELAVDCLYGGNGVYDEKAQSWSFDLTFAAKAWADGTLKYQGIFLRPTGAPNLAFGDPDTSTNAQVVLDVSEAPKATVASSEPPPPPAPLAPLPPPQPATTTADPAPAASSPPSTVSAPPSSQMFSAPTSSSGPSTPAAEVAPPQTAPSQPEQPVALDAVPASAPSTPWSVWLLLVPFVGGAWLTARSLGEELVVASDRGTGALSRLVDAAG